MKKLFIILCLLVPTALYATTFNSAQVGSNPVNSYFLQTNGFISTWAQVSASGGFPFTTATTYSTTTNATTTPLWLQGNKFSLFASSTSVIDYASTTALS